jgi:integrase
MNLQTLNRTDAIRDLNDAFRRSFIGGVVTITAGIEDLPPDRRRTLLQAVRAFESFDADNDPHGEVEDPIGPVIRSARGAHLRPNSIVNWFAALFRDLGFEGCSSHSGRRSFITVAARNVHRSGCSLRDVQLLAGHRSIETTERYIDGDTCAQRKLVGFV